MGDAFSVPFILSCQNRKCVNTYRTILTVLTPTSTLFFHCLQVTFSKKMLLKVYQIENAILMTLVWTVENDRNASN